MVNIQKLQSNIDRILQYLLPFEEFYNCHMVNYLTDNYWLKFIPENIRNSIKTETDIEEAINDVWLKRNQNTKFNDLLKFIENNEKYYIDNLNILTKLNEILKNEEDQEIESISIKEFMNEKKRHEVEIMSKTINSLIKNHNNHENFVVIDAGDGKGYLSSRLALEYKLNVLGIDANEMNTVNAQKRNTKLRKAWNGLTKRAQLIGENLNPSPSSSLSSKELNQSTDHKLLNENKYKTINEFITTDLNLNELIQIHFNDKNCKNNTNNDLHKICLTGLHTCGNLSSTCLETFIKQNSIKILCNIGCCYHLLNEKFCTNNFINEKTILFNNNNLNYYGFPLSKYLINKKFYLGRNARMLASQSIQRNLYKKQFNIKSLYYRSLLEIILKQKYENNTTNLTNVQIGKIKNFTNFTDYIKKCNEKLNLNINYDDDTLSMIENKYEFDSYYLNLFYLIRMSFALILETIILLDKLLYLKENSINNSYICKLFDTSLSPRCYAIIALR